MKIVVEVGSFYDWLPITEEEIEEGTPYSIDPAGKAMKMVHIKNPSYTEIAIPDEQVDSTYENFESDPIPFMRLQKRLTPTQLRDYPDTWVGVLAWHIGEKIMPMHAPAEDWGNISVDKNKEIEEELNRIFQGDTQ